MTDRGNGQARDIHDADDGAGAAGDPHPRRPDFALVIGIDHYPHFRSLKGAVNDAQRFYDWLTRADGGGVDPVNVQFAPSQPGQPRPLKDQIDAALETLVRAAQAAGGGRRLYFHFSGHGGGGAPIDDVALLLAEWSRTVGGRALSADKYRQELIGLHVFEEIVVLLDCCRRTAKSIRGLKPRLRLEPGPGCATMDFIAYATEAGGLACESSDTDGEWHGELTRCLLDILRAHGGISAGELKRILFGRLQKTGRRAEIVDGLPPNSTFGPRGPLPVLEITFKEAIGEVTLIARNAGNLVPIGSWPVDLGPWRQLLPNGLYRIEDTTGKHMIFEHAARVEETQ